MVIAIVRLRRECIGTKGVHKILRIASIFIDT